MRNALKLAAVVLTALVVTALAVVVALYPDEIAKSLPGWAQRWTQLPTQRQSVEGGPQFLLEVDPGGEKPEQAIEQSIKVIERRLRDLGVTAAARQDGTVRILVQLARRPDARRLIEVATRPGRLEFRMVDTSMSAEQAARDSPPAGSEVLRGVDNQPYLVEKRVRLRTHDLTDAQAAFDQRTSEPIVSFRFTPGGTRRFALVTQENVGRPFAIVLDGVVLSAPVIREPILGGSGQISGQFTVQSANDLAVLLRAGALPAPVRIIEERPAAR